MVRVTGEPEILGIMEIIRTLDLSFLPAWIQFLLIQIWWLITAPHHYVISEKQRAAGRKICVVYSDECQKLLEKYLLFRGKR